MSQEQVITELLRPIVESMGFIWWGLEYHYNSMNSILRIYVDTQEGGIGIDDIVTITEQLNPILDVEQPITTNYTLEVSSPGLDRILFTLAQCEQFIGATVHCRLRFPFEGKRKFQGIMTAVDHDKETISLTLTDGAAEVHLPFTQIDKARIVPQF